MIPCSQCEKKVTFTVVPRKGEQELRCKECGSVLATIKTKKR